MTQYVGALKDVSAIDLGAIAARGALARTGVHARWVDHVVFGNVQQSSADAHYGARHVGLKAGLPIEVPALTVNRLCGSGIQAVLSGAQQILLGEAGVVLAGGMENMSQVPHVIRGLRSRPQARSGQARRLAVGRPERPLRRLLDGHHRRELRREVRHHPRAGRRATRCAASSWRTRPGPPASMKDEVVPVEIKGRKGVTIVEQDDHLRPETTLEVPGEAADGVQEGRRRHRRQRQRHRRRRGGAASSPASGAVKARGLKPLGRIVSWATVGVEPTLMGMGPAPAIRKALEQGRAVARPTSISSRSTRRSRRSTWPARRNSASTATRSNVNGGAIALGHPLGASGARLLLTLLLELRRRGKTLRRGLGLHRRRAGHRDDRRSGLKRRQRHGDGRRPRARQAEQIERQATWRSRQWACWGAG